jgi:hypothetical protein
MPSAQIFLVDGEPLFRGTIYCATINTAVRDA